MCLRWLENTETTLEENALKDPGTLRIDGIPQPPIAVSIQLRIIWLEKVEKLGDVLKIAI